MIQPSRVLVVDTNILLAAVLGSRTRRALAMVGLRRSLLFTSEAAAEALVVVGKLRSTVPNAAADLAELLSEFDLRATTDYQHEMVRAQDVLRDAVASRNGSGADAHVLALAWTADADIWSHDRDFAGTGWRSWSSANLLAALATAEPD